MPDYFASAREAYKSLGCRNLCTNVKLKCTDTGQNTVSLVNAIAFVFQSKRKFIIVD